LKTNERAEIAARRQLEATLSKVFDDIEKSKKKDLASSVPSPSSILLICLIMLASGAASVSLFANYLSNLIKPLSCSKQ
jgi:hypothetical protein